MSGPGKTSGAPSIQKGATIEATVVDVRDNGLYLKAGGLSGFMDVTQLTWADVGAQPSDFAAVGDTITVVVTGVTGSGFYASRKALDPMGDPFRDPSLYCAGARHRGRVLSRASYGTFVLLATGAACLVRLGSDGALSPREIGELVDVEIVSFDAISTKLEARFV